MKKIKEKKSQKHTNQGDRNTLLGREAKRQRSTKPDWQKETEKQTGRQTDRQTGRQACRLTGRLTGRLTNRQTGSHIWVSKIFLRDTCLLELLPVFPLKSVPEKLSPTTFLNVLSLC